MTSMDPMICTAPASEEELEDEVACAEREDHIAEYLDDRSSGG